MLEGTRAKFTSVTTPLLSLEETALRTSSQSVKLGAWTLLLLQFFHVNGCKLLMELKLQNNVDKHAPQGYSKCIYLVFKLFSGRG